MAYVMVPLSCITGGDATVSAMQLVFDVMFALQDQVQLPIVLEKANSVPKLVKNVRWAIIHHGVSRIEPQAVHVELLDPIERIVNDEIAHHLAVHLIEVQRLTPWRNVA